MTDDEIAEVLRCSHWELDNAHTEMLLDGDLGRYEQLKETTAALETTRAENAALRAIAQAVAAPGGVSDSGYSDTNYCRCDPVAVDDDEPDENGVWWVRHRPECIIAKARALLAKDTPPQ